jgi:hypothetical protein
MKLLLLGGTARNRLLRQSLLRKATFFQGTLVMNLIIAFGQIDFVWNASRVWTAIQQADMAVSEFGSKITRGSV